MLIIIKKETGEIVSNTTNTAYPDGNIPFAKCKEDEEKIKIHDDSELAQKILNANYKWKFNPTFSDIIDIETENEKTEKEGKKLAEEKEKQAKKLKEQFLSFDNLKELIELNNLTLPQNMVKILSDLDKL